MREKTKQAAIATPAAFNSQHYVAKSEQNILHCSVTPLKLANNIVACSIFVTLDKPEGFFMNAEKTKQTFEKAFLFYIRPMYLYHSDGMHFSKNATTK